MTNCLRRAFLSAVAALCLAAPASGSQNVRSVFLAEAARHSFLGRAADSVAADENGYRQNFENGAIYFLDSAFEVHGLILGKYRQLLGPWGYLGFPLSDELTCADGAGKYSDFQNGSVYYHPTYGTHQVMGSLLAKWRLQGAETGALGYPVADPVVCDTGLVQRFCNGQVSVRCPTVDMRKHMFAVGMRVRNQSWRGTCSVFAVTCLLEYAYAQLLGDVYADLSEEYMNHVANLASGQTDDGSCFAPVAQGYAAYGVVPEADVPYNLSTAYDFTTFNLPDTVIAKGRSLLAPALKLKEIVIKPGCPSPSSMGLSAGQMDTIFAEMNKGYPVAVGRGHSLVIVGYAADAVMPGNGFFIIRNSYGPDADDCGFRYETVEHLKNTVYDTYVYEMPAGVAFGKVLTGRVVDAQGTGVANARVEMTGSTAAYGTFTRYDSTGGNGRYRIPAIISLASNVTVRAICGLGTLTRQTALGADTTVLDFAPQTTRAFEPSAALAPCAALMDARMDRSGNVVVTISGAGESGGRLEIRGLSGRLLLCRDIARGARRTVVPVGGGHAKLIYSLTLNNRGPGKNGIIRLY